MLLMLYCRPQRSTRNTLNRSTRSMSSTLSEFTKTPERSSLQTWRSCSSRIRRARTWCEFTCLSRANLSNQIHRRGPRRWDAEVEVNVWTAGKVVRCPPLSLNVCTRYKLSWMHEIHCKITAVSAGPFFQFNFFFFSFCSWRRRKPQPTPIKVGRLILQSGSGFSKSDEANPGLVKFFISIFDAATCTSLNEEKPGSFVWLPTLQCRRSGRESVSYSEKNWQELWGTRTWADHFPRSSVRRVRNLLTTCFCIVVYPNSSTKEGIGGPSRSFRGI